MCSEYPLPACRQNRSPQARIASHGNGARKHADCRGHTIDMSEVELDLGYPLALIIVKLAHEVNHSHAGDCLTIAQEKGNIHEAITTTTSPETPIRDIIGVTVRRVWDSLSPDIRVITQNPESFIHGIGFEPHPTASAR